MSRSLLVTGFGNTYTNTTLAFNPPGGGRHGSATEPPAEFWVKVPGVVDRPGVTLTGTTGTTRKIGVRKNGSASFGVTIAGGVTGCLVDDTGAAGSISLADGDRFSLSVEAAALGIPYAGQTANFNAPGVAVSILLCSSTGGVAAGGFNSDSRNFGIAGVPGAYTNANVNARCKIRAPGTAKGGFVYVGANSRVSASTATLVVNGTDTSIVVTISAGTTGVFRDTSNTATIADGDDVHWKVTNGAGSSETLTINQFGFAIETAGQKSDIFCRATTGAARTGSGTVNYAAIGGQLILTGTVESERTLKAGFPFRASNLRMLTGAAGYNTTVTVRKNGVDTALTITQASAASGTVEDTTHTVDFLATDEISYSISGGASGSTTVHYIGLTLEDISPNVGLATGSSTATAVGASTQQGVGAGAGGSTAAAGGAAVVAGAGAAAGSSAATAVGVAQDGSIGAATGTSTASGVGASIQASAGSASGIGTANGRSQRRARRVAHLIC